MIVGSSYLRIVCITSRSKRCVVTMLAVFSWALGAASNPRGQCDGREAPFCYAVTHITTQRVMAWLRELLGPRETAGWRVRVRFLSLVPEGAVLTCPTDDAGRRVC